MFRRPRYWLPATLALLLIARTIISRAADAAIAEKAAGKTALELLPASTVVYAEITKPKQLVETILNHPLRQRLEALDAYRHALESPQYLQFKFGLSIVEAQLGQPWREALESVSENGLYAGIDGQTRGIVVLAKAHDAAALDKVLQPLLKLAPTDTSSKGEAEKAEYRGITVRRIKEVRVAAVGPWLIVTNNVQLGQAVIDNCLDADHPSLAADESLSAARKLLAAEPTIWVYVHAATLRDANVPPKLWQSKTDNPVAELLMGGIFDALAKTPSTSLALDVRPEKVALTLTLPYDAKQTSAARAFYFGPHGQGAAPELLEAKETLLAIGSYRDLQALWTGAGDLLGEKVSDDLAKSEGTLTTLFGRDFGKDVLGALRPEMQVIVARQHFDGVDAPQPAIKLPAFALGFQLKEPEKTQRSLKIAFQSVVGFGNVVGAMNGAPQLDLNSEQVGKARVVSATYIAPDDEAEKKNAKVFYNFSPSLVFIDDRLIISSTRTLALELAENAGKHATASAAGHEGRIVNTRAKLCLPVLRDVLVDNRTHLVAQNMLEKGHDKQQAESEIGYLVEILGWLGDATLELSTDSQALRLELALPIAAAK